MLKFEKTVLDLEVYGESYKLNFPTVAEIEKFSIIKEPELKDSIKFLDSLGLPKEVSVKMELPHLSQVLEALNKSGKN